MGKIPKSSGGMARVVIPNLSTFQKKNELITSKSKMTLLGRKIFDLGIKNVEDAVNDKGERVLCATISGNDLQRILGKKSHSFYDSIADLVDPSSKKDGRSGKMGRSRESYKPSLLDWRIIYRDDTKREIEAINVITKATFKGGELKLYYNSELRQYLIDYKNNYTMLDTAIIMQFSSVYSYQMYQYFRAYMDYEKAVTRDDGPYEIQFDLLDLKTHLGIIDINEEPELKAAAEKNMLTYDIVDTLADQALADRIREFGDFRIYALKPMHKELNEKSDISVEFQPIRSGRGGKVKSVLFRVAYKEKAGIEETRAEMDDAALLDFIDQVRNVIREPLSSRDLAAIGKAAGYDMEKIARIYAYAEEVDEIDNLTGWMIAGLKNGYEAPVKKVQKVQKARKGRSAAASFAQSGTDYGALEESIVE